MIVGHREIVDDTLTALIAGGHVLLGGRAGAGQDPAGADPGRRLAPEVPADPVHARPDAGRPDRHERAARDARRRPRKFEFQRGPVFANLVLADEINRATPKTQSALLEAMQERSVTVAGTTHQLAPPFFVLATQNPLEMEGTYPLPEAQLDRFFFKLLVKFPTRRGDGADPRPDDRGGDAQRRAGLRRPADRRALAARPADPDRRRAPAIRRRPGPGHPPRERASPPRWPGGSSATAPARRAPGDHPRRQDPRHPRPPLPRRPRRPARRRPRRPCGIA